MAFEHLDTGTAADLLNYRFFTDSSGAERLERVATSNQKWIVKDWDGEQYVVKFANNFTKKHLYTMSKREDEVREAAYFEWESSGGSGSSGDHWRKGEHERLENKLEIASRSRIKPNTTSRCSYCGHSSNSHAGYDAGTRTGGLCSAAGCGCTKFYRYEDIRATMGKTIASPLSGAETKRNTCIVMNWIPKSEFETVICKSIQAAEKPPGWAKGHALNKSVGDTFHLRWDFGPSRKGAVVHVDLRPTAVQRFTKFQGCTVSARKTHTDWGVQTYEVYHFGGQF